MRERERKTGHRLTINVLTPPMVAFPTADAPVPSLPFSFSLQSPPPKKTQYYQMIRGWGSWPLFQELLTTLDSVAQKHKVGVWG